MQEAQTPRSAKITHIRLNTYFVYILTWRIKYLNVAVRRRFAELHTMSLDRAISEKFRLIF